MQGQKLWITTTKVTPWDKICIDFRAPYMINRKGRKDLLWNCVTLIVPAYGWFDVHQYDNEKSIKMATIAENNVFPDTHGQLRYHMTESVSSLASDEKTGIWNK
jgi:hypothetical protein